MTPKDIIIRAENLTTITVETIEEAVELLTSINRIKDEITKEKETVTRPLLDKLAEERAKWKPKEQRIEAVTTKLRTLITQYQTVLVAKQKQQEEEIAKKLEAGKISVEKAITKMQSVEAAPDNISSQTGKVIFKTVTRFVVEDWGKIPPEYLLLNEQRVRDDLKTGKKVTGIAYIEEQVPMNYR